MQNGKAPEETAENLVYTTEEYEIREEKAATIYDYIATNTVNFVSGEKEPSNDTQWNEFTTQLEKFGYSELMEVCQDAYDRQEK